MGNVYSGMGYGWIRHLTMWTATIVLLLYGVKLVKYFSVCRKEYEAVVPCSLYAGFDMVLMLLGSYYFEYVPSLGKGMLLTGLAAHGAHILVFTYRNVIKARNIHTFVPSWFVTYNGIMVSSVVGGAMNIAPILNLVLYYGIGVYFVILPVMLWRLIAVEVKPLVYHTMAVLLAPCSLCLVSYLNLAGTPNRILVFALYACVAASLIFIVVKLPKFFSFPFTPGFAGMTFPMAIGIVATNKMTGYLSGNNMEVLARVTGQLAGFQIYLTTMIIGFVLLNFLIMALRIERQQG